jgi:hypothetical protein
VTVSASYLGANQTAAVTVNPPPAVLSSVVIAPSTVASGGSATGTVTLSDPAGSGGAVVSLASSPAGLTIPANVTVAQGATTATFPVIAGTVSIATAVTVTASFGAVNTTSAVTVNPSNDRVGIFRNDFFWILDVDGNRQFDSPPDLAFPFGGIPGDIPITGDWTGNGHTKVGIYRSSNGMFILDSNGDGVFDTGDAVYNLGVGIDPTDIPVVGDWNGDGRSKVGLFRQGFLWLLDYNGDGVYQGPPTDRAYEFGGIVGDKPVVGDWTGTGTSKIGIFRLGFYWILDANGNGTFDGTGPGGDYSFPYGGISGDVPVVGDWNGSGISKVGVFRLGFFWVLDGNNPGDLTHSVGSAFAFGGTSGDKPVVGKW